MKTAQREIAKDERIKRQKPPVGRRFTMAELALALILVAMGITAIMALFPVGMNANRNTIGRANANDAADQFLHFFAGEMHKDWTMIEAFPYLKPDAGESDVVWSNSILIEDSHVSVRFAAVNATDAFDPTIHQAGKFLLDQVTAANIQDFSGVIRAWKVLLSQDGQNMLVLLNAEVSWPAAVPYGQRKTSVHSMEIFKPAD